MTALLSAMRDVLVSETSVTDVIGTRLYPNKLPQNPTFPAVVCAVVSEVPLHTLAAGGYELASARVQFDVYARRYEDARAAWAALELVLRTIANDHPAAGLEAWLDDTRDLYEDAAELHRVSADVTVWRRQ